MPVPKRKRSRARRDSRFANKGLKVKSFALCAHCSEPISPHQACKFCGYYKGKKVMTTKVERAVKRGQARQAKAAKQPASEAKGEAE